MKGIGVDLVDLRRLDLENETFIKHVLSNREYACFIKMNDARKREYLGGRFAAKEAYLKANGLGLGGMRFREIEVLNDQSGAPYLNDPHAKISISNEKDYVVAFVVIE